MKSENHSRRNFLRKMLSSSVVLSTTGITGTANIANAFSGGTATPADYRALICVFLYGGNDSSNMVVPVMGNERHDYESIRGHLSAQNPLEVNLGTSSISGGLGFNSDMLRLKNLFDQGKVAIQANVGTENGHRFAHNSQQEAWLSGLSPQQSKSKGWAGKMLEKCTSGSPLHYLQNISLDGSNTWSAADQTQAFSIGAFENPQVALYHHHVTAEERQPNLENHFKYMRNDRNALLREYANTFVKTEVQTAGFQSAINNVPPVGQFGPSALSQQLRRVIDVIQLRQQFSIGRQIFFVGVPGFDTHNAQNRGVKIGHGLYRAYHANLLHDVSESLAAFYDATVSLGIENQVTAFTMSEFGRTMQPNDGGGSDHGWGGHQLIVGGSVNGGLYGKMPILSGTNTDLLGKGILKPTTHSEQMSAGLAKWFGLTDVQCDEIFPGLNGLNLSPENYFNI